MSTVLLILQLVLSVVLTGLILVQRSEGGALGIGGGGGGFMSGRSATNSIVKVTSVVGAIFVLNCIALTVVFNMENADTSILDVEPGLTAPADSAQPDVPSVEEILGTDPVEPEPTETQPEPETSDTPEP